MASTNLISILIAAKDEASATVDKTAANISAASAKINDAGSSLNKAGTAFSAVGGTLTRDLTLPIMALGGVTSKMAYDFNQKMELLHTSAGIPQSAIAGLTQKVLDMSGKVAQSPDQLADGFYHIASAGNGIWNTSQMLDILKVASEGANLGMADLGDTTYSLSSAMASGIKGAKNASDMMAILNATVGAGDMKMQDLNAALSTGILSTGASFGVSIQSIGAALATLTDNGEHADEAATRLRMTLALMTSPSGTATKQLKALGLTAEDAKNASAGMNKVFAESGLTTTKLADDLRQPNGVMVAIQDLKTHLENAGLSAGETDAMLSKAFGGGRTDAALLTMIQNVGRMQDKFTAINDGAGQFQKKLQDLENTPQYKIQQSWDSIQSSLTKIGSDVLPVIAKALPPIADDVQKIADAFNKLGPGGQKAVIDLALALAALGPVLKVVGTGFKALSAGKDIFLWLGRVGIPTVVTVLGGVGDVLAPIAEVLGAVVAGVAAVVGLPVEVVAAIGIAIVAVGMAITAFVVTHTKQIDQFVQNVVGFFKNLGPNLSKVWTDLANTTVAAWNGVVKWTQQAWVNISKAVQIGVGNVGRFLAGLPGAVGFALGDATGHLVRFATVDVPSFTSTTIHWFQQLPSSTANLMGQVWQNVSHWFGQMVTTGISGAQSLVAGVVGWFARLPQTIGDIAAGMWSAVSKAFDQFMVSAENWASNTVNAIVGTFTSLPGKISNLISNAANNAYKGAQNGIGSFLSNLGRGFGAGNAGHALGTNYAPGGLTWVGETGPELVNLPRGSQVFTASESRQIIGGSGGTNIKIGQVVISNQMDEQKFLRHLGWMVSTGVAA